MGKIEMILRDSDQYDNVINEIGKILAREKISIIEALGILECVKEEVLMQNYYEDD